MTETMRPSGVTDEYVAVYEALILMLKACREIPIGPECNQGFNIALNAIRHTHYRLDQLGRRRVSHGGAHD